MFSRATLSETVNTHQYESVNDHIAVDELKKSLSSETTDHYSGNIDYGESLVPGKNLLYIV